MYIYHTIVVAVVVVDTIAINGMNVQNMLLTIVQISRSLS